MPAFEIREMNGFAEGSKSMDLKKIWEFAGKVESKGKSSCFTFSLQNFLFRGLLSSWLQ